MRDSEESTAPRASAEDVSTFIGRWGQSGGAEQSNYALFLTELCDLLRLERPQPARPENHLNDYVFERLVTIPGVGETTIGRIDLYKRGCFVLEAKQGVEQQVKDEAAHRRKGVGTRGGKG